MNSNAIIRLIGYNSLSFDIYKFIDNKIFLKSFIMYCDFKNILDCFFL